MAKANRGSAKNFSTTHPVLTGENRRDWALWQLSSILIEIAEHSAQSKDDDTSTEKQMRQKMNNRQVFPQIEDASDV